jgi:hypothetical protein
MKFISTVRRLPDPQAWMRFASFRCPAIFLGRSLRLSHARAAGGSKPAFKAKIRKIFVCHSRESSNEDRRILKPGEDAFGGFVDGATRSEPLFHGRKAYSNMLQSFGLVEKLDHFGMQSFRGEVALKQLRNNLPAGNQIDQAVKGNLHQILANDPG